MSAAGEEQLRLVTDVDQLRAGMIVVIKPCSECAAASHRAMLFKQHLRPPFVFVGCPSAWEVCPRAPHHSGLCACVVRDGRVFVVVDGLEDPWKYDATLAIDEYRAKKSAGRTPTPGARVFRIPARPGHNP